MADDKQVEQKETKPLSFYGASDDLIYVDGSFPGCDEYNSEREVFVVAGLRVSVEFGARGTWGIGVEQIDETVPVTAERMELGRHPEIAYSLCLVMDVPVGTVVTREARDA